MMRLILIVVVILWSQIATLNADDWVYWKTVKAKVTAYEPSAVSCGKWSKWQKTSTGKHAKIYDGVAVCPKAIPYGTAVWIDGIGWRVADDTGGAMRKAWRKHKRYHVDVRMPTVRQCRQHGVKYVKIHLYRRTG